jgi:hypothetical protein
MVEKEGLVFLLFQSKALTFFLELHTLEDEGTMLS